MMELHHDCRFTCKSHSTVTYQSVETVDNLVINHNFVFFISRIKFSNSRIFFEGNGVKMCNVDFKIFFFLNDAFKLPFCMTRQYTIHQVYVPRVSSPEIIYRWINFGHKNCRFCHFRRPSKSIMFTTTCAVQTLNLILRIRADSHWRTSFKCHNIFDKNKIVATSQRHFGENKRCNY